MDDDDDLDALVKDVESRFLAPEPDEVARVVRPDGGTGKEMKRKGDERALELGGFKRRRSIGDGNCGLRSISQAVFGHQNCYPQIRQAIVALMKSDRARYNNRYNLTPLKYNDYMELLEKDGHPVGYDVLQAAADLLQARIFQTFANGSNMITETVPHDGNVFYEINVVSFTKHMDTLGREHVYIPLEQSGEQNDAIIII